MKNETDSIPDNQTRLLDMLAGWIDFVDPNDLSMGDKINSLYQDAGNLSLDESDGEYNENEPTDERIRQFIIDKVIPLVLDG